VDSAGELPDCGASPAAPLDTFLQLTISVARIRKPNSQAIRRTVRRIAEEAPA
jgi:hypothetical protein